MRDSRQKTLAESLGIPNANGGGAAGGLTNISISGTVGLGDGSGSLAKINNNYEYSQALSWVNGSHEFKFGGDIMSRRFSFFSPTYPVGQMGFSGVYYAATAWPISSSAIPSARTSTSPNSSACTAILNGFLCAGHLAHFAEADAELRTARRSW